MQADEFYECDDEIHFEMERHKEQNAEEKCDHRWKYDETPATPDNQLMPTMTRRRLSEQSNFEKKASNVTQTQNRQNQIRHNKGRNLRSTATGIYSSNNMVTRKS